MGLKLGEQNTMRVLSTILFAEIDEIDAYTVRFDK